MKFNLQDKLHEFEVELKTSGTLPTGVDEFLDEISELTDTVNDYIKNSRNEFEKKLKVYGVDGEAADQILDKLFGVLEDFREAKRSYTKRISTGNPIIDSYYNSVDEAITGIGEVAGKLTNLVVVRTKSLSKVFPLLKSAKIHLNNARSLSDSIVDDFKKGTITEKEAITRLTALNNDMQAKADKFYVETEKFSDEIDIVEKAFHRFNAEADDSITETTVGFIGRGRNMVDEVISYSKSSKAQGFSRIISGALEYGTDFVKKLKERRAQADREGASDIIGSVFNKAKNLVESGEKHSNLYISSMSKLFSWLSKKIGGAIGAVFRALPATAKILVVLAQVIEQIIKWKEKQYDFNKKLLEVSGAHSLSFMLDIKNDTPEKIHNMFSKLDVIFSGNTKMQIDPDDFAEMIKSLAKGGVSLGNLAGMVGTKEILGDTLPNFEEAFEIFAAVARVSGESFGEATDKFGNLISATGMSVKEAEKVFVDLISGAEEGEINSAEFTSRILDLSSRYSMFGSSSRLVKKQVLDLSKQENVTMEQMFSWVEQSISHAKSLDIQSVTKDLMVLGDDKAKIALESVSGALPVAINKLREKLTGVSDDKEKKSLESQLGLHESLQKALAGHKGSMPDLNGIMNFVAWAAPSIYSETIKPMVIQSFMDNNLGGVNKRGGMPILAAVEIAKKELDYTDEDLKIFLSKHYGVVSSDIKLKSDSSDRVKKKRDSDEATHETVVNLYIHQYKKMAEVLASVTENLGKFWSILLRTKGYYMLTLFDSFFYGLRRVLEWGWLAPGSIDPIVSSGTPQIGSNIDTSGVDFSKINPPKPEQQKVWSSRLSKQQSDMLRKVIAMAQKEERETGIPTSITVGQWALESGLGSSELATKGNNYFGVKAGSGWTGNTITMEGSVYRVYDSLEDSIRDHTKVLLKKIYSGLMGKDYVGWASGLEGTYAEDVPGMLIDGKPSIGYKRKLTGAIESYGLYEFDVGRKSALPELSSGSKKPEDKAGTTKTRAASEGKAEGRRAGKRVGDRVGKNVRSQVRNSASSKPKDSKLPNNTVKIRNKKDDRWRPGYRDTKGSPAFAPWPPPPSGKQSLNSVSKTEISSKPSVLPPPIPLELVKVDYEVKNVNNVDRSIDKAIVILGNQQNNDNIQPVDKSVKTSYEEHYIKVSDEVDLLSLWDSIVSRYIKNNG